MLMFPQIFNKNGLLFGLLVLCAYTQQLTGCAQTPLRIYPQESIKDYALTSSIEYINISVKPVINAAELKHYLGTDIFSDGILSIYIVIENLSNNDSYLVSDSTFMLGEMSKNLGKNHATSTAGTGVVVGSIFTPLILFPAVTLTGISMANNASRKNLNIERNTFPNGTLSPGETEKGFTYFQVPNDLSGELALTVKIKNLDTRKTLTALINFALDLEKR